MIQHLILSTIIACAGKKNENTTPSENTPSPSESPTEVSPSTDEELSSNEEMTSKPDLIGPGIKPPELITQMPVQAEVQHQAEILVQHITNIQKSNQEIECTLLCQQTLINSKHMAGTYTFSSCEESLAENWAESIATSSADTVMGSVSCVLQPQPRIMRGRAPMNAEDHFIPTTDLATHFARQAQEEALSVFSFAELYHALQAHNAPSSLLQRCTQALREEQMHTQMAISLCQKYGGEAPTITVPLQSTPNLFALTLHNALVGCIQESWAALLEQYQAIHGTAHHHIQHRIAQDEISHAQLAWDIHAFLMSLLGTQEQEIIRASMHKLLESKDISYMASFPNSDTLGIPSEANQQQLHEHFSKLLIQYLHKAA